MPLYQFIRRNEVPFDNIQIEIICKMTFKTNEHRYKHERYWIESFQSISGGQNNRLPWVSESEKLANKKHMNKEYSQNNYEYIKQYKQDYYTKNKETIKQHRQLNYHCE